ncbi:MAG: hypothetical protein AB7U59_14385 [Desulfovibrionaceae bacterium]
MKIRIKINLTLWTFSFAGDRGEAEKTFASRWDKGVFEAGTVGPLSEKTKAMALLGGGAAMALRAWPGAECARGAANGAVPKQRLPARYGLTRGWSRIIRAKQVPGSGNARWFVKTRPDV